MCPAGEDEEKPCNITFFSKIKEQKKSHHGSHGITAVESEWEDVGQTGSMTPFPLHESFLSHHAQKGN
jgi:hypothetical protein